MGDLGREPTKGAFQSRAFGCQQKVTGPLLLRKLFPQLILAGVVKGCKHENYDIDAHPRFTFHQ